MKIFYTNIQNINIHKLYNYYYFLLYLFTLIKKKNKKKINKDNVFVFICYNTSYSSSQSFFHVWNPPWEQFQSTKIKSEIKF